MLLAGILIPSRHQSFIGVGYMAQQSTGFSLGENNQDIITQENTLIFGCSADAGSTFSRYLN
jgi:hypothetical protein